MKIKKKGNMSDHLPIDHILVGDGKNRWEQIVRQTGSYRADIKKEILNHVRTAKNEL